ncbi:MAG TPA: T9SS type A sorting domain-containing protein [Flavilitoribacter sp.]|nr:T9SS type A sorting domain-containing protein [Flavilitoribacter sp.]
MKRWLLMLVCVAAVLPAFSNVNPKLVKKPSAKPERLNFRESCDNPVSPIDQAINNVRARLNSAGDVWWDGDDGRYVVPKVPPGVPEVSSIFAGAVWLGGKTPAGEFKVATQTYGRGSGSFDFWSGPLVPDGPSRGTTSRDTCAAWDRFFVVTGDEIRLHIANYKENLQNGTEYREEDIPAGVKGWPGKRNPFFSEIHNFDLPDTEQGLAGFWDENLDGYYNPLDGDYPVIEIRGCVTPQFPDEMIFWIYNDAGNTHEESDGLPIRMEVQVQAFAYKTSDEINNMTFQRYKLVNRAVESIDSMYFAMWVDPDLGCYTDDYVGCDIDRSLAFVYNKDAADGTTGTICDGGVQTYGTNIPLLGVDYFRGPLNENGEEIGMSSFTYYNNGGVDPTPLPPTTDPQTVQEYYYYLSGRWRDGTPFTFGDDGYNDGAPIRYAFPDPPNQTDGWSMCAEDLPVGDRRTVQASGPFRLDPGAVNELIIGVVWVPTAVYPCPDITALLDADDIAQNLFDNCFRLTRGPDAPDIDWVELDQEIIAVFSNDTLTSNNAYEAYAEPVLRLPEGEPDSLYRFEGYRLFQLSGPSVTLADRDDPAKVREIYTVDLRNGIAKIFNWDKLEPGTGTPTSNPIYVPELQVNGGNSGIRHTFKITQDQFAEGDRRLINHKKYYFAAVAYAYNNYQLFDPVQETGQREPYLEGDRNVGDGDNAFYTVIPRPIPDRKLQAVYGEGVEITRLDGIGTGGNFLDFTQETVDALEEHFKSNITPFKGELHYQEGRGPVQVQVFNPLEVVDGEFELAFFDGKMTDTKLDDTARWVLRNLSDPSYGPIYSERQIKDLNEQVLAQYGFSITVGQPLETGVDRFGTNGARGYEESYLGDAPKQWFQPIPNKTNLNTGVFFLDNTMYAFAPTETGEKFYDDDPNQQLTNMAGGIVPFYLCDWEPKTEDDPPYITPAWTEGNGGQAGVRARLNLADLNNVDIVFTSDKSLWSKCAIIETANKYWRDAGFITQGGSLHFDLRNTPSVSKDADPVTKLPLPAGDGTIGYGYFPGYAVDVESGQRLNIFFGENSTYDGSLIPAANNGADMMFNPSDLIFATPSDDVPFLAQYNYVSGGQHFIYVTKVPYDGCEIFRNFLRPGAPSGGKVQVLREVTWAGLITAAPGMQMRSYDEGLIPTDVRVKIRVDNPYKVETKPTIPSGYDRTGSGANSYHPLYRFKIDGKQPEELTTPEVETALDEINVVPNPYYGFSDYENTSTETLVKITNLPPKCTVTIFSLDGKFIRQYTRDERSAAPYGYGIQGQQIIPDLEWDLKNKSGIPVASGVYLIHISAPEGERTIKWFGVNRKFDPTGL